MTLKVFEAFAGIGTQRMALKNLNIDHEVIGISEIDKFAIKSYESIHGPTVNYGDISKIDPKQLPDIDLFTFSFPCQDISSAGEQRGFAEGSNTRSSLLWECQKIIEAKKPSYLLMENVNNLVSKKFKPHFERWLTYLESLGYTNYWKVLNSKDYSIPQNRKRVFAVSILNDQKKYEWPLSIPLTLTMNDLLEKEVDEKYYLSQDKVDRIIITNKEYEFGYIPYNSKNKRHQSNTVYKTIISPTITAVTYKDPMKIVQVGNYMNNSTWKNPQTGRIFSGAGLSPSILTETSSIPKVIEPHYRIRKVIPLECWRLMGISDSDFYKAQSLNSNTQLYKQAGNAIVVDVLEAILKNLLT